MKSLDEITAEMMKHSVSLLNYAKLKTGIKEDAEDLVQESFKITLKWLIKGKEIKNIKAFLFKVLKNQYKHYVRKNIRLEDKKSLLAYEYQQKERIIDDPTGKTKEEWIAVRQELAFMCKAYREVMVEHYMKGEKVDDIAKHLGISEGTIKWRLAEGREQMKKGLENDEYYINISYEPENLVFNFIGKVGKTGTPNHLVRNLLDCNVEFIESILQYRKQEDTITVVFMTTTDYNFACSYCIENGIQKDYKLHVDVVNAFLKYIQKCIHENEIKNLSIMLYGGEPTLAWEHVVGTLSKVQQICIDTNINLITNIITNGYLFDKQKVMDLLPFNLNSVQITLDGTREFHDQRRYTNSQKPTFDTIVRNLKNILKVSKTVNVLIRMNCDRYNISSIPELSEFIYENIDWDRVFIDFGNLIIDKLNISDKGILPSEYLGNIAEHIFAEKLPNFYKTLDTLGFNTPEYYSFNGYCMAKTRFSFCLHPSGDIYKCMCEVGKDEYKSGNVFNSNKLHDYFDVALYDECIQKKCCFLPICHTGCSFKSRLKFRDILHPNCNRKQFEAINKEIILSNLSKSS